MEVKKSQKADLEGKKTLFLEIGLCVSLMLMIGAFAWGQDKREPPSMPAPEEEYVQEEVTENTVQDIPVPQIPTPANIMTVISPNIQIVDNNTQIETEQIFTDFNEDTQFTEQATVAEIGGDDFPGFYEKVEQMPRFQGGDVNKFSSWLNGRVVYPDVAREMSIQGTVRVRFIVGVDGKLTNIEVISNTDRQLNNEVLRVVRQSPKWEPGVQQNAAVPVRVEVSVVFRIQ